MPLFAVLVVDFFVFTGRGWDLSVTSAPRWANLAPWALGFVAYQLINPGYLGGWSSAWHSLAGDIGFTPPEWMSASVTSFLVAAVAMLLLGAGRRLAGRPAAGRG